MADGEEEYGIDPIAEGNDYDFEDAVQSWVAAEMTEYGVDGGNWPNVTEVTE